MILKQQAIATQAGVLQSPGYRFQRAVTKALDQADDPSLRETTPQTLSSISLADVQNFYKAAYRPDLTTIVVIGDITPEKQELRSKLRSAPGLRPARSLWSICLHAPRASIRRQLLTIPAVYRIQSISPRPSPVV